MPNDSTPKVTVVIATYNKADALRHAVESVLWQTYQDFEIWVMGDACSDNTAEVVASFNDPRIHWYNLPENTGYQSEPNNKGIRCARGQYIAYLNHDDIWLRNHLELLVGRLEETGADFVYSILEKITDFAAAVADIPLYPNSISPPEASVVLHRKSAVDEIGYWKDADETYTVPRAEFFRRAEFHGSRFELVPVLTVLKFGWSSGKYRVADAQTRFVEKIRNDPDFVNKEVSALLVRAHRKLNKPVTLEDLMRTVNNWFRQQLIKRRIDPGQLLFWKKPGHKIRRWRRMRKVEG